jgi:molybdopterin molybdotransferase
MGHVGNTPMLGLPGNPASAFVTFLLFAKPLLAAVTQGTYKPPMALPLPAGFSVDSPRQRPEYIRAIWLDGAIVPAGNQSSGVLSSLQIAEGLALIPEETTLYKGDDVLFYPLHELIYS